VQNPSTSAENKNTQVRPTEKCQSQEKTPKLIYSRIITLGLLDQEDHKVR
jgi:hypothetical protein